MARWEDLVAGEWRVMAAALSSDDRWAATTTLGTKARASAFERFGEGYLALFSYEADQRVFSRLSDAAGKWAAEVPVLPDGERGSYTSLDVRGKIALFTLAASGSRVMASLFDGTSWMSNDLGPGGAGTTARVGDKGYLVAWLYQRSTYAAAYDLQKGWGDPIKLGATTAEDFGPAIEVDSSGNALAAWPDGAQLTWRRYSRATDTWSEPLQLKDQDPYLVYSTSDASGNVMLIWSNPLGIWASRFE